jgi:RNA polymerase sigma-70 factor (ECF subfamily)
MIERALRVSWFGFPTTHFNQRLRIAKRLFLVWPVCCGRAACRQTPRHGGLVATETIIVERDVEEEQAERVCKVLRRAVARVCPKELEAHREDIVQEAALRLLERASRGESNQSLTASYLWKVALTTALDELRRLRRRNAWMTPAEDARGEEAAAVPRPELAIAIRDGMGALSADRRSAVVLYLEGFCLEESAAILQWDSKRVKNLIYRGLADLRVKLGSRTRGANCLAMRSPPPR